SSSGHDGFYYRIKLFFTGNKPDICCIAFIAGTRMTNFEELNFHDLISSTVTFGKTAFFLSSAGQYATTSLGFGRPPAKPVTLGGPVRINGVIFLPNSIIDFLSCPRTANLT